jgi:predicted phage tail component-like protein
MGIIFDGTTSKSKKIHMRIKTWQSVPALRNNYVEIPGKTGVYDFGSTSAERVIEAQCSVFPQKDSAALTKILDEMAEWLNPDKGVKQLVFSDMPDRYYMARLSDAVNVERLIRSAGTFTLKFVCPDPHAYAVTDEIFTIPGVVTGGSTGAVSIIREKGNTNSDPVYYLSGRLGQSAPVYFNITTNGVRIQVAGVLNSDETLIIDSGKVTAKVVNAQGETLRNGLPMLFNLEFPVLRKGQNTVEVFASQGASFNGLKIQAMSRWR